MTNPEMEIEESRMKKSRIWIAVFLTVLVVVCARRFGPNKPYEVEVQSKEGVVLSHRAERSHDGEGPAVIPLKVLLNGQAADQLAVTLEGRIKGETEWQTLAPARTEDKGEGFDKAYIFEVPHQPVTTRYFYRFKGTVGDSPFVLARDNGDPMMVKFKDPVPGWVLYPHVAAMFGGFFLLIWSALIALSLALSGKPTNAAAPMAWWSWIVLFVGGVPIGFAMNYYAFHVMWEAWPFGGDVTDNKTQVALAFWGIAALALSKGKGKKAGLFAAFAALITLAIYLIPHSAQVG
jgi:hypothetical protein